MSLSAADVSLLTLHHAATSSQSARRDQSLSVCVCVYAGVTTQLQSREIPAQSLTEGLTTADVSLLTLHHAATSSQSARRDQSLSVCVCVYAGVTTQLQSREIPAQSLTEGLTTADVSLLTLHQATPVSPKRPEPVCVCTVITSCSGRRENPAQSVLDEGLTTTAELSLLVFRGLQYD